MHTSQLPDFSDIPARRIAYAASGLIIGLCALAFVCQIELKKDVTAEIVVPGEVKIQRISGLVSRVYVQANTPVKVGTPLFEVERDLSLTQEGSTRASSSSQQQSQLLQAIAHRTAVQRREFEGRIDAFSAALRIHRSAQSINQQEILQAQQQVEHGQNTVVRLRSVAEYVEIDRIERAEAELAQRRSSLARQLARRGELAAELANTGSSIREARAELAKLDIQESRDQQEARDAFEKNRSSMVVSSPVDGLVAFSQAMRGRYLREEDIVMAITATGERRLQAILHIPSRQRGFVRQGQVVRLKFDAFPYARFGSYEVRLDRISDNTVANARPSAQDPAGQEEQYLAYASLPEPFFVAHGERHQILSGMRATAAVVIERRSIAEWLLQPLFEALRG